MPPRIFEIAFWIRMPRVSAILPDITQHTHSFFASGVMSSHNASTFGTAEIAFLKSAGTLCTIPLLLLMEIW